MDFRMVPIALEHAPAIQALVQDDRRVLENTRMPDPYPEDGAIEWIRKVLPMRDRGEQLPFAILDEAGTLMGGGIVFLPPGTDAAEVGYWVGAPYRGQGLATDVARWLTEHAFRQTSVARVIAITLESNVASQRVLEKVGLRRVARQPAEEEKWRGQWQLRFEIGRREWLDASRGSTS